MNPSQSDNQVKPMQIDNKPPVSLKRSAAPAAAALTSKRQAIEKDGKQSVVAIQVTEAATNRGELSIAYEQKNEASPVTLTDPLQNAHRRLALATSENIRLGENSILHKLCVDIVEIITRVEQVKTMLSVKFSIPVDKVEAYTRQMTVLGRTDKELIEECQGLIQEDKNRYIEQILQKVPQKELLPTQTESDITMDQLKRLHIVDLYGLINDEEFFKDFIKPIDEDILTQIRSINDERSTELRLDDKNLKVGQLAQVLSKLQSASSLTELYLRDNKLTALPESIGELNALH